MCFLASNIRTNNQNASSKFEGLIHKTVSIKPFSNQEVCHINLTGKKRICAVSTYIEEFLSIVEIENKKCKRCSKLKTPVEVISDKLIMFLEELPNSDSPRQIYHSKCTTLTNDTVFLDVMLQNYFKDSF